MVPVLLQDSDALCLVFSRPKLEGETFLVFLGKDGTTCFQEVIHALVTHIKWDFTYERVVVQSLLFDVFCP